MLWRMWLGRARSNLFGVEVELQQSEYLLQRTPLFGCEVEGGDQQIYAEGGPDL